MGRLANRYMKRHFLRRAAAALIALFLFAQAGVVLAACAMDRASMAQAMTMPADQACECGGAEMQPVTAGCVAHCTVDLQLAGFPLVLVHGAVEAPVLLVPVSEVGPKPTARPAPPPLAVPRRILLHSFLI